MKPSSKRVGTLIARAALFECEPFYSKVPRADVLSETHPRTGRAGILWKLKDAIELRRLLRMRGERPRHRAADKRKEISPFQWQLISLNLLTALWASLQITSL